MQAQEAALHAQTGEASPVVVAERGAKASAKGQPHESRWEPIAAFLGKARIFAWHVQKECAHRHASRTHEFRKTAEKRMFFLIFVLGLIPKSVFFIFFIVSGWDKTEKGNRGEGVVPEGVVPEGVVPETTNRQTEI